MDTLPTENTNTRITVNNRFFHIRLLHVNFMPKVFEIIGIIRKILKPRMAVGDLIQISSYCKGEYRQSCMVE